MRAGHTPLCEEELDKAYRLLEEVEEISRTGGWEFEVATGHIAWTAGVYRVYGVDRDFNTNDLEKCLGFYSPDDAPVVEEAFRKAVDTG